MGCICWLKDDNEYVLYALGTQHVPQRGFCFGHMWMSGALKVEAWLSQDVFVKMSRVGNRRIGRTTLKSCLLSRSLVGPGIPVLLSCFSLCT